MRIVTCLVEDHSLLLVGLAAVVCIIGATITMNLYNKLLQSRGVTQATWLFMGGAAGGATIWCTHFIAMLAWRPGVVTSYQPFLTGASLLIAILGASLALWLGSRRKSSAPMLGGVVFGLTITAMHYVGMKGMEAHAILHFDSLYLVASVLAAAVIGAAAFMLAARQTLPHRMVWSSIVTVLAIVSLHFTGMAAVVVVPLEGAAGFDGVNSNLLALGVAAVGLLLLGSALASYSLQEQAQKGERRRLRTLINGSVDGMVVELEGNILMANQAFIELCGIEMQDLQGASINGWIEDSDSMNSQAVVQSQLHPRTGEPVPVEVAVRIEPTENGEMMRMFSVRDLRRRLEQERRISFLARNDSLTGLPNRASFLEKLARMVELHPDAPGFALMAIDLDRFKDINDLYGHGVGDQLLVHISSKMKDAMSHGQFIARLGGDEFVAIVPLNDVNALHQEAEAVANRIRDAIVVPMQGEHTEMGCGASIGIALWPEDAMGAASTLINNADLAMYRAKASMAENICFYDKSMDEAVRRRRMTQDMRDALDNDRFNLFYQPQVDLGSGEITGYEALLRWQLADGSYVSPDDFIPVAEDTGLILPIGEWVLRRACKEAMLWDNPLRLAVNLSPVQLAHSDLPRLVHEILIETGFPASRLELEITETAMISDMVRSTHILRQLKALGVSIAMDDFGTGYSSLSTLRAFPFDKIKLDRAFMAELECSAQSRAIIRAVLTIGESLNIPVLAEGVETSDQLDFLREHGCDEVQGFLLGRPARQAMPLALAEAALVVV